MRNQVSLWLLLGVLTAAGAYAQTPAPKRPPVRGAAPIKKNSSWPPAATLQPLKPGELVKQLLDSMRVRPALQTITIPLPGIQLTPGTYALAGSSQPYLDSVAVALNRLPTLLVDVHVYTNAAGDPADAQMDADKRAGAIWSYLILTGKVAAYRSHFRGYTVRPTAASRVRYPRVELALTGLDTSRIITIYQTNAMPEEAVFAYNDKTTGTVLYKTAIDAPLRQVPASQVTQMTTKPRSNADATPAPPVNPNVYDQPSPTPSPASPPRSTYRYTLLTIGPEGRYTLPTLSPQWADDAIGVGLRQGVGGSLRLTRRFGRWAGLSVQAGYVQWETMRQYTLGGESVFDETARLEQLSLQLGLKLYVGRGLYLMPAASGQATRFTATSTQVQPVPPPAGQQQQVGWGYGGEVGYELTARHLAVEISAAYHTLNQPSASPFRWYYPLDQPFRYLSLRVGIGFWSTR